MPRIPKGGEVKSADAYVVGERRPETFIPARGIQTHYHIDARAIDPKIVEQRVRAALVATYKTA